MATNPSPKKAAARKRILIVDDHPVFRAGLTVLIEQETELTVCGEASDARHAAEAVEKLNPDLAILDIGLPDRNGLELLKDLRVMHPNLPVLVISMHDETLYAERVIRAGGRGYIMKQSEPERIIDAIRKVLAGGVHVSERMAALILDRLSGSQQGKPSAATARLTDREVEVLRHIGQGREAQDIAQQLHLSVKTVDTHRANLRKKLGLNNATELIHYATRWVGDQM